jgi:hypothetical protein
MMMVDGGWREKFGLAFYNLVACKSLPVRMDRGLMSTGLGVLQPFGSEICEGCKVTAR